MTAPELERFASRESGARNAFAKVSEMYFTVDTNDALDALNPQRRRRVTQSFLSAGLSYLANNKNTVINGFGTSLHRGLASQQIQLDTMDPLLENSEAFHLPPQLYAGGLPVFIGFRDSTHDFEKGTLIVPPNFSILARREPVAVIAELAKISSLARDAVNGRFESMVTTGIRALAASSHFLLAEALEDPSVLTDPALVDVRKHTVDKYPRGIYSFPEGRYMYADYTADPELN